MIATGPTARHVDVPKNAQQSKGHMVLYSPFIGGSFARAEYANACGTSTNPIVKPVMH